MPEVEQISSEITVRTESVSEQVECSRISFWLLFICPWRFEPGEPAPTIACPDMLPPKLRMKSLLFGTSTSASWFEGLLSDRDSASSPVSYLQKAPGAPQSVVVVVAAVVVVVAVVVGSLSSSSSSRSSSSSSSSSTSSDSGSSSSSNAAATVIVEAQEQQQQQHG